MSGVGGTSRINGEENALSKRLLSLEVVKDGEVLHSAVDKHPSLPPSPPICLLSALPPSPPPCPDHCPAHPSAHGQWLTFKEKQEKRGARTAEALGRSRLSFGFDCLRSIIQTPPICPASTRNTLDPTAQREKGDPHPNVSQTALIASTIIETLRELMPKTLEGQITMEKTPSYFVTREAPARISTMSRDTKLIVVVRDPVTRAISDYTQTLSKKPDIPSFESLTFKNRTTGLIDTSWSAIQIGIYAKHLDNWLQYFPMKQILFVSGERLISDPAGELGRVQDFLGLKRIITDKHFYFNQTKGFPCLKKAEGSSKPHCLGKTKGRTHPNIDPEVVQRLRDFYRPFNMKFYQMTGHNFAAWFNLKPMPGSVVMEVGGLYGFRCQTCCDRLSPKDVTAKGNAGIKRESILSPQV
ncbi:hypothetical protein FQN60_002914 [Etheostoma spectabile]|uniref:Sulfotransferase n=1 Tax=Etheostoma spectabile TaxID=54343 RepID=A0A5J5CKU6_9PERO|nr:hypothetical protein FQN60_002914 [Etheostoma spectabile]